MDHLEATALGATERYVLGTLGESEREAFEEHFFDCLECAEDVRAAAALLAGARSLPEAPGERLGDIARKRAAAPAQRRRRPVLVRRSLTMLACAVGGTACLAAAFQRLVTIPRLEDE